MRSLSNPESEIVRGEEWQSGTLQPDRLPAGARTRPEVVRVKDPRSRQTDHCGQGAAALEARSWFC